MPDIQKELAPCPFCGKTSSILKNGYLENQSWADMVARCTQCCVFTSEVIWNTRPIEDELRDEIFKITEIGVKHQVDARELRAEIERLKNEAKILDANAGLSSVRILRKQNLENQGKLETVRGALKFYVDYNHFPDDGKTARKALEETK